MKILHFADLHLGNETYGTIDSAGVSTRLKDVLKVFDELVDYAVQNRVDLVLFCGDAYKSRDPSQTQQREFARRLHRLSSEGIPIFLLVGNHDLPSAYGKATTMEIYHTLAVQNAYVGADAKVYRVPTPAGDIQIAAMPWPRRSSYLTREDTKNQTLEEINANLQLRMTERIEKLVSNLDPNLPAVLAAHVFVATARIGSERSMVIGRDPALLPGNVALPAFDYIALGHIHRHQVLCQEPPLVYSGSLERLDFSDEGIEKGFCVVEITQEAGKRHTVFEFRPVSARRFLTIRIDLGEGDPDPALSIMQALSTKQEEIKDAVVRLQLSLPASTQGRVNDTEIRRMLKEAHHVSIAKEVQSQSRTRLGDFDAEGLTPLDALKVYFQARKVSSERQQTLLRYAQNLIQELEEER